MATLADLHVHGRPRGTISVIAESGDFFAFWNDVTGTTLPHVMRKSTGLPSAPSVLATDTIIDAHITHGQSWVTERPAAAEMYHQSPRALRDYREKLSDGAALTLAMSTGVAVRNSGVAADYALVVDLVPVDLERVSVTAASALALAEFRKRAGAHLRPSINYCHGWPGSTWPELGPGGSTGAWPVGLTGHAKAKAIAAAYNRTARFVAVLWIQGVDGGAAGEVYGPAVIADVLAAYDALDLNAGVAGAAPLIMIHDQHCTYTHGAEMPSGAKSQADFAIHDETGRHFLFGPRYAEKLRDVFHHSALGNARIGEMMAYVEHVVLDLGEAWKPLHVTGVALAGAVITLTTNVPPGFDGHLVRDADYLPAAADDGWRVEVDGVEATIAAISYSGTAITLTLDTVPAAWADIEWSYAWYGAGYPDGTPEAPQPGGCIGNVRMAGPNSVLFGDWPLYAWLVAYRDFVTAGTDALVDVPECYGLWRMDRKEAVVSGTYARVGKVRNLRPSGPALVQTAAANKPVQIDGTSHFGREVLFDSARADRLSLGNAVNYNGAWTMVAVFRKDTWPTSPGCDDFVCGNPSVSGGQRQNIVALMSGGLTPLVRLYARGAVIQAPLASAADWQSIIFMFDGASTLTAWVNGTEYTVGGATTASTVTAFMLSGPDPASALDGSILLAGFYAKAINTDPALYQGVKDFIAASIV